MKKLILIIIGVMLTFSVMGQFFNENVRIENLDIVEDNDKVYVSFSASIKQNAVQYANVFVFSPVFTDGNYKVSLPAVVVQGKGTKIIQERHEWVAHQTLRYENAFYTENGKTINYLAEVEAQKWMDGANLIAENVLGGCCSYNRQSDEFLAKKINLNRVKPQPIPVIEYVEEPVWEPVSVADTLSTAFTFVVPDSEFDEKEPFKIYDDERENSLIIYFRVAKYDIAPEYMDNVQTLQNLTAAINMITRSGNSRVERVVVAGFASPEGKFEFNDRLAFERGVSVKEFLMKNCDLRDKDVLVFNGSVDWRGLRSMVAKSNYSDKQQILHIIDNTPIIGSSFRLGRLEELQKLNDGRTYNNLLNEYFPYLRNGAFIKVFYKNN